MSRPETIGVFGANGFIGRRLVRRLVADGRTAVAFGRNLPADYWGALPQVETRVIDFTDVVGTHAKIQDITTAVMLVNNSGPGIGNARVVSDLQANVLPHVGFIESCVMAGVTRIVFISSGGTVYGPTQYVPIDEAHPTRPTNSYGMTKLVVEQYLHMMLSGTATSYRVLRVSNPYGPGQLLNKGQGLVASIHQCIQRDQPVSVFGDGGAVRDFLYVEELQDAIVAAIDVDCGSGIYNIGSGVGHSILDVIEAVGRVIGRAVKTVSVPARATDVRVNVLDCRKAKAELGWSAKVPLDEGLARTFASL